MPRKAVFSSLLETGQVQGIHRVILPLIAGAMFVTACGGRIDFASNDGGTDVTSLSDAARDSTSDAEATPDAQADQDAHRDGAAIADAGLDAGLDAAPMDAALPADASEPDASEPDAGPLCTSTTACPPAPSANYDENDGLLAIDPCAFPIQDDDTWQAKNSLIDELAQSLSEVGLSGVLSDLNRTGGPISASDLTSNSAVVPGFVWGIEWNSGDENVDYWIPQGLTGSPDADPSGLVQGRRLALVTWYYDQASDPNSPGEKGVRISLVDITQPASPAYRLLLLVDPYDDGQRANFRAINIHAGGVVWYGRYLFVADTSRGFRVFDMQRILQVATSLNQIGYDSGTGTYYAYRYKYVVPQVTLYRHQSACSPRFSYVGLDRSTNPPSLLSGEYANPSIAGTLLRWSLDPATGTFASGLSYPEEAWYLGKRQVQGAVSHDGIFFLSSSEPPSGHGDLTRTRVGSRLSTSTWTDSPEDLVYDSTTGELWGCSEGDGVRFVFGVDVSRLP